MLGHFGPCWHHIGLMLGHFGLFSDLCRPLSWTWAFQCRWIFVHARRLHKIPGKNTICGLRCWWFLLLFFLFLFLSWGMLQLGYVCLISGLCWAIVGYVGTILGSCWAIMLGHFVVFCGLRLPLLSHFRGILGSVSAFVLDLGISVSLNFRPCNAFAKNTINTLFLPISIWYDR